jgi:hypothetical protein
MVDAWVCSRHRNLLHLPEWGWKSWFAEETTQFQLSQLSSVQQRSLGALRRVMDGVIEFNLQQMGENRRLEDWGLGGVGIARHGTIRVRSQWIDAESDIPILMVEDPKLKEARADDNIS